MASVSEVIEHQDIRHQLPKMVSAAAWRVWSNYSEFVDRDDLEQEGWVWAASNQKSVDRLLTGQPAPKRMMATLMRYMDRIAREAKAAASGYRANDAYWYSSAVIEMVLVEVMQGTHHTFAVSEREERVGTVDPSHGNNWPVIIADVMRAWARVDLPDATKTVLAQRYGCSLTLEAIAELTNQSRRTVQRRIEEGLQALSDELNQTIDVLRAGGCSFEEPERGEFPEEDE